MIIPMTQHYLQWRCGCTVVVVYKRLKTVNHIPRHKPSFRLISLFRLWFSFSHFTFAVTRRKWCLVYPLHCNRSYMSCMHYRDLFCEWQVTLNRPGFKVLDLINLCLISIAMERMEDRQMWCPNVNGVNPKLLWKPYDVASYIASPWNGSNYGKIRTLNCTRTA